MLKRFLVAAMAATMACGAFAQETAAPTPADLEKRVHALETRIDEMQKNGSTPQLDEVRRQIDILTREIENLKTGEAKPPARADISSYGLGAAASKVYRAAEPGVSFGGYGEFLYQNPQNGPATADLLRAVLYTGYKFSDRALFNSELEVEHASTERGGDVSVEFGYLDYLLKPAVNFRAGLVLMPMGIINEQHEPTSYLATTRPVSESIIIPSTWSELGAGVFGDVGRITYRAYLTNGLSDTELGGEVGLHETPQRGAQANASRGALVGRLDFHPVEGTLFGTSYYRGSVSGSGRVTLADLHADARFRGALLRAVVVRGTADRAVQQINTENPLGGTFGGWYAVAGYDIASMLGHSSISVTPFARYEKVNTQRSLASGLTRNPANDRSIFTAGFEFKPVAQSVIKVDWSREQNALRDRHSQLNVGLGYIF